MFEILKLISKIIGGIWFAFFFLLALSEPAIFGIIAAIGLIPLILFRKKKVESKSSFSNAQKNYTAEKVEQKPLQQTENQKTQITHSVQPVTQHINIRVDMGVGFQFVHPEVLELLWFKNGPFVNYKNEPRMKYAVDMGEIQFTISLDSRQEPSLIDVFLPVDVRTIDYSPIGYFPSYEKLTPSQKYTYLNWLKDITTPIDIGYVFIFYYGLERHLLFGKFEKAFEMILKLRKHHLNGSFMRYSGDALLLSIMIHKRFEYLELINLNDVSPDVRFLVNAVTVKTFSVEDIVNGHKKFTFTNTRYIKSDFDLFKTTLEENLVSKYSEKEFRITPNDWKTIKKRFHMVIANFSLLPEQRVFEMPDITTAPRIQTELNGLLAETHEQVKLKLKEIRKNTPSSTKQAAVTEKGEETDHRRKALIDDHRKKGSGVAVLARAFIDNGIYTDYDEARKEAQYEMLLASSVAAHESMMQNLSVNKKNWLYSGDHKNDSEHCRNHASMDGQIVPKGKPFKLIGLDGNTYYPMYPRDPILPIEERYGCRCIAQSIVKGGMIEMMLEERKKLQGEATT